jgi:iron complex outermembrane receptor protein
MAGVSAVPEEVEHTPGGARVVDLEEFRDGRASSVSDALGSTPGVYYKTRSGDETSEAS